MFTSFTDNFVLRFIFRFIIVASSQNNFSLLRILRNLYGSIYVRKLSSLRSLPLNPSLRSRTLRRSPRQVWAGYARNNGRLRPGEETALLFAGFVKGKLTYAFVCLLLIFLSTIGCGISNDKLIGEYNDFAIRAAKADLWNEAVLRWQRIIEIDPNNAKAHNNLGVAYEAMERFDEALKEYEKAIELDPGNEVYRRNFFKCQRNKNRSWHTKGNGEEK